MTNTIPVFFDAITLDAVNAEIVRAQSIHGWHRTPLNPDRTYASNLAVLVEEVGEVAKALNEDHPPEELIKELIQTAAMALAWAEAVDKAVG